MNPFVKAFMVTMGIGCALLILWASVAVLALGAYALTR